MEEHTVTCFDCHTPPDAPLDVLYRDGFICHNCGSRYKVINAEGIPIRIRVIVSLTKARGYGRPSCRPTTPQSFTGESLSRTYKVQVSALDDDPDGACVVNVSTTDGRPVVSGVGTSQLETLQELVPYMLDEEHPQYPTESTAPDDE